MSAKIMLDQPGQDAVGGAAAYGLFSYVLIPFVLYWVSFGFNYDSGFRVTGQLAHHVINFVMMIGLFREYLRDAFLTVQTELKAVLRAVALPLAIIAAYYINLWLFVPLTNQQFLIDMLLGSLPISEVDVLLFTPDFIGFAPIPGILVTVLLTPITTTCLYYAVGFAPVCYKKPGLAYLVVMLVLAIPRVINSLLFWSASQELAIYLGQLPVHLLACISYHESDTVWAPIFCLAAANLFSCVALFAFYL